MCSNFVKIARLGKYFSKAFAVRHRQQHAFLKPVLDGLVVELDELGVLLGNPSSQGHGIPITSARVSRCTREVGSTITSRCQDSVVTSEAVERAVFHVDGHYAYAAVVLHDEV